MMRRLSTFIFLFAAGCQCQKTRQAPPYEPPPNQSTVTQAIAILPLADTTEATRLDIARQLLQLGSLDGTVPVDPTRCEQVNTWLLTAPTPQVLEYQSAYGTGDCTTKPTSWRIEWSRFGGQVPDKITSRSQVFTRQQVTRTYQWGSVGWIQRIRNTHYTHGTQATSPPVDQIARDLPSTVVQAAEPVSFTRVSWQYPLWRVRQVKITPVVVTERCAHGATASRLELRLHDDDTAYLPARVMQDIDRLIQALKAHVVAHAPSAVDAQRCAPLEEAKP